MSWQITIIVVLGGFLLLIPLMTYLSSRRMVGKKVTDGKFIEEDHLLYFYNQNCGPCRHMTPIIDRLSKEHGSVTKIDVAQDPDTARAYGIRATPTTILVKGHVVKEVLLGAKSAQQLERLLAEIS